MNSAVCDSSANLQESTPVLVVVVPSRARGALSRTTTFTARHAEVTRQLGELKVFDKI